MLSALSLSVSPRDEPIVSKPRRILLVARARFDVWAWTLCVGLPMSTYGDATRLMEGGGELRSHPPTMEGAHLTPSRVSHSRCRHRQPTLRCDRICPYA